MLKTSSRGASNVRVARISRSPTRVAGMFASFPAAMWFLPGLKFLQVLSQTIETLLPEAAVMLDPIGDVLEVTRLEAAGPPLSLAPARDQAGTLQDLEMLGNARQAHFERFGQLGDRGFSAREPR